MPREALAPQVHVGVNFAGKFHNGEHHRQRAAGERRGQRRHGQRGRRRESPAEVLGPAGPVRAGAGAAAQAAAHASGGLRLLVFAIFFDDCKLAMSIHELLTVFGVCVTKI